MRKQPKPVTPKPTTSTVRSSSVNRQNATIAFGGEPPKRALIQKNEPEPELNEIDILYDDYLLSLAAEVIMKKTVEEREKTLLHQVAALAKTKEKCEKMLHAVRDRIRDIKALDHFEICIKKQLEEINIFLETHEEKILTKLEMIYSVLESYFY